MNDTGFRGLSEIGLAVNDVREAAAKFSAAFGSPASEVVTMADPGVEMQFSYVQIGNQRINLMQDTNGSGPVGRALGRRGEGLFNIMIEVDDLDAAMDKLRAAGVDFVEQEPRVLHSGTHGGRRYDRHRIAWTLPRTLHGLLIELQEFDWAAEDT